MIISMDDIPKVAVDKMNSIHATEIDILNKLYNSVVSNKDSEEIDKYLKEFIQDVEDHFNFEQGLMEKYNFFAYIPHKMEHDRIRMELSQLNKNWEKSKNPDLIKTYIEQHFIPWLVNHVQTMDTVTAMYLKSVGYEG